MIIGVLQNTVVRDKALTSSSKNASQVLKNLHDFRSSIDGLSGSTTSRIPTNYTNKEN